MFVACRLLHAYSLVGNGDTLSVTQVVSLPSDVTSVLIGVSMAELEKIVQLSDEHEVWRTKK